MMAVVDNDDETSEEECSYEAEENWRNIFFLGSSLLTKNFDSSANFG
jgi:hypothetical protein